MIVRFDSVSKVYPKHIGEPVHVALKNVSLHIDSGLVTSIIGANGAGKSTVIKHIIGVIKQTSGTISLFGDNDGVGKYSDRMGYLPEVVSFNNSLSVFDNIKFNCKLYGIYNRSTIKLIDEWLERMDIVSIRNRSVSKISKGQRQRVAFINAVIHNPDFIILDEPMSGLDPIGRKIIIDAIFSLKETNTTMLICSHLLDDIQKFSENIILLHKGEVLAQESLKDILNKDGINTLEEHYVKSIGMKNV